MSLVTVLGKAGELEGDGFAPGFPDAAALGDPAAGEALCDGAGDAAAGLAEVASALGIALGAATGLATARVFFRRGPLDCAADGEELAAGLSFGLGVGLGDGGAVPSWRVTAKPPSGGKGKLVISVER